MRGRQIAFAITVLLVAPLWSQAGGQSRLWQEGELQSRRTVPVGRTFLQNRFVYRVRGFNCSYLVVSETPLKLDLFVPMKFSTDRNQIIIKDADGKEQKVRILQKVSAKRR